MTIQGSANWGQATTGAISFHFSKAPIKVNGTTAWFGNDSKTLLGLDWAASSQLKPVFQNDTDILSYSVGSNFSIDPTVVTTVSEQLPPSTNGNSVVQLNGYYWIFYEDYTGTTNAIKVSSSQNGTVWSTPTTITTDVSAYYATAISPGTSDLGIVYWEPPDSANSYNPWVIFQEIILNTNGTVTVGSERDVLQTSGYTSSNPPAIGQTSIVWSKTNNRWLIGTSWEIAGVDGLWYAYEAVNSNVNGSGSWTVYSPTSFCYYCAPEVEVLSNEYVLARSDNQLYAASSVNGAFSGAGSLSLNDYSSIVLPNSTVVVIGISYPYGSTLYYLKSSNWTAYTTIGSSTEVDSLDQISLVADSSNDTFAIYLSATNTISSIEIMASKGVIGPSTPLQVDSTSIDWFSSVASLTSYTVPLIWEVGTSTIDLKFGLAPLIVPTAATSGQPWGKPGLSPYESYFAQPSEYVSPGNGLLGVAQTDLSLPGRGLNLTLSRIFSTPYSFYSSGGSNRTFNFDNFTLSNLGAGWELSLPWIGSDYLHLWDGQVYAFNWTGNVFANHEGENFVLYSNTNNGSYSLFDVSGTRYYFNSNLKLTLITDAIGNNSISLRTIRVEQPDT